MTAPSPLASASREIRAPRSHVYHRAADLTASVDWLWDRDALPEVTGESTRPDGSRRVHLSNGEVLSSRLAQRDEPRHLEIETQQRSSTAGAGAPGRTLGWHLDLEPGPGTTRASLKVFRQGDPPPAATRMDPRAQALRWQRQVDAALDRFVGLCEKAEDDEGGGGVV